MQNAATAEARTIRPSASHSSMSAKPGFPARPRLRFGTGLFSALTRLARTAEEDLPDVVAERSAPARHAPNRCEFDYDYYVALQSRRRHQPSRRHHGERTEQHGR